MEIGIDSFAKISTTDNNQQNSHHVGVMRDLLERIEYADQAGLHVFGIGEHHRKEFLDSSPTMILAAAAAKTSRIRLTCERPSNLSFMSPTPECYVRVIRLSPFTWPQSSHGVSTPLTEP